MHTEFALPDAWWDWSLANSLSGLQVILTAAGFLVAWLALRRTARAVESSAELLEGLQERLTTNDLLVLLPDLHGLEEDLDNACSATGSGPEAERVLRLYARKAGEILGIMDSQGDLNDDPMALALRQASRAVVKAKGELSQGTTRSLAEVTAPARQKVAKVSQEASSLRSRLQRKAK
ncbi:MAG TPA: hypothetical protein VGM84_20910 [Steroidobacteraceae bacterium]